MVEVASRASGLRDQPAVVKEHAVGREGVDVLSLFEPLHRFAEEVLHRHLVRRERAIEEEVVDRIAPQVSIALGLRDLRRRQAVHPEFAYRPTPREPTLERGEQRRREPRELTRLRISETR